MSKKQKIIKRIADVFFSLLLAFLCIGPILFLVVLATFDTRLFGVFVQERVGFESNLFNIFKIRTLNKEGKSSRFGKLLRTSKLDELPQIFNVLKGDMSLVGPRPDIRGYADKLKGDDRIILTVRPGITGPASLKFRNEESMLNDRSLNINETSLWKRKIEINKMYIREYSLGKDITYMFKTIFHER